MENILKPHNNPLVIEANIGPNFKVTKIMVDTSNSVDIFYINAFKRISGKAKDLTLPKELIYGFTNIAT